MTIDRLEIKYYLIVILLFITSCAATPFVVEVTKRNDRSLNCEQLMVELAEAERYKKEARKEDRFRLRYMNPMVMVHSIYNINVAEGHAKKRIEHLMDIMMRKRCNAYMPSNP